MVEVEDDIKNKNTNQTKKTMDDQKQLYTVSIRRQHKNKRAENSREKDRKSRKNGLERHVRKQKIDRRLHNLFNITIYLQKKNNLKNYYKEKETRQKKEDE